MKPSPLLELGRIVAPSGKLLIVDPGYLRLWSGPAAPVMPEGLLSPEGTRLANEAVDVELVGPDATKLARALDRQWNPRFLYDTPRSAVAEVRERARELGLSVDVRVLRERVSHRRRIDLALSHGDRAGEILFQGVWAAVFGDVPLAELTILGEPMPEGGPEEGRLRRVSIVLGEGPIARSEQVAFVAVDYARLLVIDADAVSSWTSDEARDGLADFVFWGRDAEQIAARFGAPALDEGTFGWKDLPVQEALARGAPIEDLSEQQAVKLATDFRPHSHLYDLMKQVRASETGSGVVRVDDALACGFVTTWGDGMFEVHRDLDARGRLLRIRIELGTEQRVLLMQRLRFRWTTFALVSRKIVDEGLRIGFGFRVEPHRADDSGWVFTAGVETQAYCDDPKNLVIVRLSELPEDRQVDALLDEPVGSVFERRRGADSFSRVTDWAPED